MSKYLLIETKGPLDGGEYSFDLGKQLKELRHDVTVFLLQDGVFMARKPFEAAERLRQEAEKHGLTLMADGISMRQRGIVGDRVAKGVQTSDMNQLVDLMMERTDKAIWH